MLADFSVAPLDKGFRNLSRYVAKVIKVIEASGLAYRMHAMGTVVEGDRDRVFRLIKRCHDEMLKHSKRVYTVIKIDDLKGAKNRITGKIDSVRRRLRQRSSQKN